MHFIYLFLSFRAMGEVLAYIGYKDAPRESQEMVWPQGPTASVGQTS